MNCLKYWREKAGLVQIELAQKANVCREVVSQIESGKRHPSIRTKQKLITALSKYFEHTLSVNDIF